MDSWNTYESENINIYLQFWLKKIEVVMRKQADSRDGQMSEYYTVEESNWRWDRRLFEWETQPLNSMN